MNNNKIIDEFQKNIYGYIPAIFNYIKFKFNIIENDKITINNIYVNRIQIEYILYDTNKQLIWNILIYIPVTNKKVNCILGLNFNGNYTVYTDENIIKTKIETEHKNISGYDKEEWQIEYLLKNNFAVCTLYLGQIKPSKIPGKYDKLDENFYKGIDIFSGNKNKNEWGTIYKWAWGLNKVAIFIKYELNLNIDKIILYGLSRLGKSALWSMTIYDIYDSIICACSGRGGAANSKRNKVETVEQINKRFPTWFCDNYKKYNNNTIKNIKIDQELLLYIISPKRVYISSSFKDKYSDIYGELLTILHSEKYYKNIKKNININFNNYQNILKNNLNCNLFTYDCNIGYHCSNKVHGVYSEDWIHYLKFLSNT